MNLLRHDRSAMRGYGTVDLYDHRTDILRRLFDFDNLITDAGLKIYAESGVVPFGGTRPAPATGMQLGTGTTNPAKNGAGSAIGTFISGSSLGFLAGYPTSTLVGDERHITMRCVYGPAFAAANITELAVVNQSIVTNSPALAANTLARSEVAPFTKPLDTSMYVTWIHTFDS